MSGFHRKLAMAAMICALMLSGKSSAEDGGIEEELEPRIMVWVEVNACEVEADECWSNDGPHPVISFDSSGMDPLTMKVQILLDGGFLYASGDPSGDASIIMRSPHEFASREAGQNSDSGQHIVEARIVAATGGDAVLARDSFAFGFDLRQPASPTKALDGELDGRGPCSVAEGSHVVFDYRGGDGHGTHQPVLHAAFHASTGPVIEFGMGFFSTPMLHELCRIAGR